MSRLSEDNNVLLPLPRFFLHVDWPTFREFRISFMRGREGRGLLFVPVELIFWCLFVCIKIDGQCTCAKCTTLSTVFWNGKLSSTKFLCRLGDDENFENCRNGHTCDLGDVVTMFLWGRIGWDQLLYHLAVYCTLVFTLVLAGSNVFTRHFEEMSG